jgi:RNA polymerase sigma factor (sigma-70 family)
VVQELVAGDGRGFETLYQELWPLRLYFVQHLGSVEADDLYHETIYDLVVQIRRGDLNDPARLVGYARSIVKHKVGTRITRKAAERRTRVNLDDFQLRDVSSPDPESAAIRGEHTGIAMRILMSMSSRDREVMTRFYSKGQGPEQIQHEMGLNETQFRNIKCRAKQHFVALCQARYRKRGGNSQQRDNRTIPIRQLA